MNGTSHVQEAARNAARLADSRREHSIHKPHGAPDRMSRQGHANRLSDLAIHKLSDLFDFEHFFKDHVPSGLPSELPAVAAHEYTLAPHGGGARGAGDESVFAPLDVSESSGSHMLGLPPPAPCQIDLAARAAHEVPCAYNSTLMNYESQLFLHDLISGDIYDE
ncbi:KLTH0F11330p [Lachancea thermotolerans CBS 6340]|uniref:KLTH0F11330p n=1 Tax=Lachancea thermotolerans (strain ATCC 56472 / CBS 6340 / NRRL Y-8284) TaxID=559295 RepID=C5DLA2_LACTC|nr:KLTH0F11330p [Lachancea thermotolerans CBS 6340]CAR24253.1 KLTH0F11330p [Lachancea thermotolerans CBS 6340]